MTIKTFTERYLWFFAFQQTFGILNFQALFPVMGDAQNFCLTTQELMYKQHSTEKQI